MNCTHLSQGLNPARAIAEIKKMMIARSGADSPKGTNGRVSTLAAPPVVVPARHEGLDFASGLCGTTGGALASAWPEFEALLHCGTIASGIGSRIRSPGSQGYQAVLVEIRGGAAAWIELHCGPAALSAGIWLLWLFAAAWPFPGNISVGHGCWPRGSSDSVPPVLVPLRKRLEVRLIRWICAFGTCRVPGTLVARQPGGHAFTVSWRWNHRVLVCASESSAGLPPPARLDRYPPYGTGTARECPVSACQALSAATHHGDRGTIARSGAATVEHRIRVPKKFHQESSMKVDQNMDEGNSSSSE
jgi:hypothetical protein